MKKEYATRFSTLMEHHDPRISKEEMLRLIEKVGDDKKVIDNWDALLRYGIDVSYLLGVYTSEIEYVGFPDCISFLLDEKNVPVASVFVLVRDKLAKEKEEDNILKSLKVLSAHGLNTGIIGQFIKDSLPINMIVHEKEWGGYLESGDLLALHVDRFLTGEVTYDDLMDYTDELSLLNDELRAKLEASFRFLMGQWEDVWDNNSTPYKIIKDGLKYRTVDELTKLVENNCADQDTSIYDDLDMVTILLLYGANLDTMKILEKIEEKEREDDDDESSVQFCGEYYGCVALAEGFSNNDIRKDLMSRIDLLNHKRELRDSIEYIINLYENRGNGIIDDKFRSVRTLISKYGYDWCCGFMDACQHCHDVVDKS